MRPVNFSPLLRAERKYWRQVRRDILHPLPLLYSPPVIFGTSVEEMTHWQAVASFNEEMKAKSKVMREKIKQWREAMTHSLS